MAATTKRAGDKNKPSERDETSAQTFVRLGKGRTSKAIKQIRTLRSLNNYDHSKEQAQKIVAALTKEIDAVAAALAAPKGEGKTEEIFDF